MERRLVMTIPLPSRPDMEWLRKAAKDRLAAMRAADPGARLFQAQLDLAREHGFASWRLLKAHVDSLSLDGQVVAAAMEGDAKRLGELLDAHPAKIDVTGGDWQQPLLHLAAHRGHTGVVDLLLARGFPVDRRDRWDKATALHWAAGGGHVAIGEKLIAAGADVNIPGDAHEAGVIGWAVALHHVARDFGAMLLAHGARHTIFTAVAMGDAATVTAMIAADRGLLSARMSRFEQSRTPLHLAVRLNLPDMVALLLKLGARADGTDGDGHTPLKWVNSHTDKRIPEMLLAAGAEPAQGKGPVFRVCTPILNVKNAEASADYYVEALGWKVDFTAGDGFIGISRDNARIFLCQDGQGHAGTWVHIWVDDVDALYEQYKASGALIHEPPTNYPWGDREMAVTDLDGHIIRHGSGQQES
jgi:ankyrin repeat protein